MLTVRALYLLVTKNKSQKKRRNRRKKMSSEGNCLQLASYVQHYIPDIKRMRLTYRDLITDTCSGSQTEYVYRLNSCFDPDLTGVGGQPAGFDQWKVMYGYYRVVAVRWTVVVLAQGSSGNGLLAVAPSNLSASYLDAPNLAGLRHAKSQMFSFSQRAVLSDFLKISRASGCSDYAVISESGFGSAIGGNPASPVYLHIGVTSGTSATMSLNTAVELEMYVQFEGPLDPQDAARRKRLAEKTSSSAICGRGKDVSAELADLQKRIQVLSALPANV